MTKRTPALLRVLVAAFGLLLLPSCVGSLNAGDQGGVAFIFFAIMLIATCVILWFFLGREE
jgi:putative effector of murein hydrolase LrgA (UPF0299 family)